MVMTVVGHAAGKTVKRGRRLPRLAHRWRFTSTLITRLLVARGVRAIFPQRRTVRAGVLRALPRAGSLAGRSIGSRIMIGSCFIGRSPLLIGRSPAGRRMISVESVESLT